MPPPFMYIDPKSGTVPIGFQGAHLLTVGRHAIREEFPFEAVSTLIVDPKLKGESHSNPWWLIAESDIGIIEYYRAQTMKQYKIRLDPPGYGSHVSIVRGEEPINKEFWHTLNGREVQFRYTHLVYTNGFHWWLNVLCPEYDEIRVQLGFPPEGRSLHLTVGRVRASDVAGVVPEDLR